MSPAHLNDHHHALFPPPLKTNKDSRSIKKPSPSSSSSSTTAVAAAAGKPSQQQQRHPVIIYTHSPKIIHTQPHDFMALVQKLTGLSGSSPDDEPKPTPAPAEAAANSGDGDDAEAKGAKAAGAGGSGEDNECSSVITEENCSSSVGDGQVNSCFAAAPPNFEASNGNSSYLGSLPFVPNNAADFLCSNQPGFYDFNEATVFGFPADSVSSYVPYSGFERVNDFREF